MTNVPRRFASAIPNEVWDSVQHGVMRTLYRGIPFYKSPFDIALYLQLIGRLKPSTIIEVGTKYGGSALWFADTQTSHGLTASVITVDIAPLINFEDPRISVIRGNALSLGEALTRGMLESAPHPWLVIEDSAHLFETSLAVLRFFHEHLLAGDYIVVEDGIVTHLNAPTYRHYEDGPNRAVQTFLLENPDSYIIDSSLCDLFGFNATYNPNAWLSRQ
jgi:cephalosporin hydroxylase